MNILYSVCAVASELESEGHLVAYSNRINFDNIVCEVSNLQNFFQVVSKSREVFLWQQHIDYEAYVSEVDTALEGVDRDTASDDVKKCLNNLKEVGNASIDTPLRVVLVAGVENVGLVSCVLSNEWFFDYFISGQYRVDLGML